MTRPAGTSLRLIFILLAAVAASFSLLQSLLNPALPILQHDLNTTRNTLSWVLIAFLLSAAVSTPILGRIGDTVGKVRTLVFALSAIVAGNLVAALAPNIEIIIVGRAIQGLGAAAFPLSFGIIRDEFPSERVAPAVATLASIIAVGGGVGTVLAGPIVAGLGWRWLFWLPMAFVMLVTLLIRWTVPESPVRHRGRINWLAAALLAGWLVSLLLPLSLGNQWGWTSPIVSGFLVAFAALFGTWLVVETRAETPLIDMNVMRLPAVWRTNLVAFLFGATMFSVWIFLPQLLQIPSETGYGFGASVSEAGWIILPMLVTMAIAGTVAGRIAGVISFRTLLATGSGLVALSCLGFGLFHANLWELGAACALFGAGLGFAYSTLTNIIVQSVPHAQTAAATGMNANIRTIGGAVGAAAMTAIVTAHHLPSGYPVEQGFTTGFLIFAGVSGIALVVCLMLREARVEQGDAMVTAAAE